MPGVRETFGRVDAIVALLNLLEKSDFLDGLQIADAWPGATAKDELAFFGSLSGPITQGPYMAGTRTTDDDEFTIPVHIQAGKTAGQPKSIDARRRCEELMTGVRQTVATAKTLNDVQGLMYVTNAGADGPDPELMDKPVGWVAYGTVRVDVRIRMR